MLMYIGLSMKKNFCQSNLEMSYVTYQFSHFATLRVKTDTSNSTSVTYLNDLTRGAGRREGKLRSLGSYDFFFDFFIYMSS